MGLFYFRIQAVHIARCTYEYRRWPIISRQSSGLPRLSPYRSASSNVDPAGVDRPTTVSSAQLDITSLEATVRQFLKEGLAASTRKVYKAGWNRYIAFSGLFNIPPFPLTTEKVTLFVAYLGSEGLSVSTIQSYMAVLRHFQILADPGNCSPSFHSPHMGILLREIKRCQSLQGQKQFGYPLQPL